MMRPEFGTVDLRAGACDRCILDRKCCGDCWCCPWPRAALPNLVALAARRPDLDRPVDGWWSPRHVGLVLAEAALWNA